MDRARRAAGRRRVPAYTGFESFRDSASSPYARSERRRLSSEDTWRAINEKLHRLIRGISEHAAYRPVDISPEQLHRWHRYLFGADFVNGGTVRRGVVEYPVRIVESGRVRERHQRGSAPERIGPELLEVCDAFRRHIDVALGRGGRVGMMAGALAATKLYVGILRIHPYEDGNGRLAFVALEAALRTQDLHVVTFDDIERHDQALGWALRDDCIPEYEPLARLVVERINVSERDDPEYP